MSKRSFVALALAFTLAVNAVGAFPAHASVAANSLIKVDGNATVYWHDNANQRHAFPTSRVFNSWFSQADLNRVLTVSPAELSSHPLGASVTYRPGVRMIKVTTDPRVYAVSRYGTLRWISSEAVAIQLYGNDWARKIDDVRDDMFFNYQIGEPITRADQYNVAFEYGLTQSPSDNIRPTTQTPPLPTSGALLNGRLSFSISNSSPVIGSNVLFSANLEDTSNNAQDLSISFLSTAGETLYTCTGTFRCSYTLFVGPNLEGFTRTYFTRVRHANGQTRDSGTTPFQVYAAGYNNQTSFPSITVSNAHPAIGETVTITAYANGALSNPGVLSIIDANGLSYQSCTNSATCTYTFVASSGMGTDGYSFSARFTQLNAPIVVTSLPIRLYPVSSNNTTQIPGTSVAVSFDRVSTKVGESFKVYATVSPQTTNPPYYTVRIYDQFNALQHTCERVRLCTLEQTLSPTTDLSRSYYAKATADNGQELGSAAVSIPVTQSTVTPPLAETGSGTLVGKELQLVPGATTVPSHQAVLLKAQVVVPGTSTLASGSAEGFKITISNEYGEVLNTCLNTLSCDASETVYYRNAESNNTRKYTAAITDTNNLLLNAVTPIINVEYVK